MDRMLVIRTADPQTAAVVNADDFDVNGVLFIPLRARWEPVRPTGAVLPRDEPARVIGAVVEAACAHTDTRLRWSWRGGRWYPINDDAGYGQHADATDSGDAWTDLLAPRLLLAGTS